MCPSFSASTSRWKSATFLFFAYSQIQRLPSAENRLWRLKGSFLVASA